MVLKRTLGVMCGEGVEEGVGVGGGVEETIHNCCIKQLMKGEVVESEGKGNCAKEVTGCRGERRDGKD